MFNKLDLNKTIERLDSSMVADIAATNHDRLKRIAVRVRARYPEFLNNARIKPSELMEWTKTFAQILDTVSGELGEDDTVPESLYVKYADFANVVRGLGRHHTTSVIKDLQKRGLSFEQARDFSQVLVALNNQYPTTFSKLKHPGHYLLRNYSGIESLAEHVENVHSKFVSQF